MTPEEHWNPRRAEAVARLAKFRERSSEMIGEQQPPEHCEHCEHCGQKSDADPVKDARSQAFREIW